MRKLRILYMLKINSKSVRICGERNKFMKFKKNEGAEVLYFYTTTV